MKYGRINETAEGAGTQTGDRLVRSPGSRLRRAVLAGSISTLLSLAAVELVCRRVFGVPLRERLPILEVRANPWRGYEMIPGSDHYTYEHLVHVNNLGLRGLDVPAEKTGEVRILCLGDSLTYGQGVAEEDTLPARLERTLREGARDGATPVRVINGALRGYATVHELGLLQELGERIRPDVVVILWYPNDLEKQDVAGTCAKLARSGPVAFDTERRMEGWPVLVWQVRQLFRHSALLMEIHDAWSDWTIPKLTPEQIERGLGWLDRDLGRFSALAVALDFDVVVAAIPEAEKLATKDGEDPLADRVRDLALRRGFGFVDLTGVVRDLARARGSLPVLPYDGHYTAEANAAMARRLADLLRERLPPVY